MVVEVMFDGDTVPNVKSTAELHPELRSKYDVDINLLYILLTVVMDPCTSRLSVMVDETCSSSN